MKIIKYEEIKQPDIYNHFNNIHIGYYNIKQNKFEYSPIYLKIFRKEQRSIISIVGEEKIYNKKYKILFDDMPVK